MKIRNSWNSPPSPSSLITTEHDSVITYDSPPSISRSKGCLCSSFLFFFREHWRPVTNCHKDIHIVDLTFINVRSKYRVFCSRLITFFEEQLHWTSFDFFSTDFYGEPFLNQV